VNHQKHFRLLSVSFLSLGLVGLSACGSDATAASEKASPLEADAPTDEVFAALQKIPGMTVTRIPVRVPTPNGTEQGFLLELEQPVDHFDASKGTFKHRATLMHRGFSRPTVLSASGYNIFVRAAFDNEISYRFEANNLLVEHRYFAASTPEPTDWKNLDIRQSAFDFHRFVEALKPLYNAKWVNTGASKGGMTSVYLRRFFPNDVEGTVAFVAPHSYGRDDPRYQIFLERVGSKACREKLIGLQRAMLKRRAEILPIFEEQARVQQFTYQRVPLEKAFEHTVQEYRYALWQYNDEETCAALPAVDAPAEDLAASLDDLVGVASLASDQSFDVFNAYYYQVATQLGSYGPLERHISDLLKFPRTYLDDSYSPVKPPRFDYRAMFEVQAYVALFGERLLFIYGENDPWTAGQFQLGAARDSAKHVVPQGNHGAFIGALPAEQHADSLARLTRWLNAEPRPLPTAAALTSGASKLSAVENSLLYTEPSRKALFEMLRKPAQQP
jgi:hypothetical protein